MYPWLDSKRLDRLNFYKLVPSKFIAVNICVQCCKYVDYKTLQACN